MKSPPASPTEEEVHAAVDAAIDLLCASDQHLLDADASERSLSHRLAVHLIPKFQHYEIDCEYNRDGFSVKKLMLSERGVKDDELDAVTVFPDIIVHKRQTRANLLVIEAKKIGAKVDADDETLAAPSI